MELAELVSKLSRYPRTYTSGSVYGCEDVILRTKSDSKDDFKETYQNHMLGILATIARNKGRLCFVRVLPEESVTEDGRLSLYTRLQFGDRDKVGWGDL